MGHFAPVDDVIHFVDSPPLPVPVTFIIDGTRDFKGFCCPLQKVQQRNTSHPSQVTSRLIEVTSDEILDVVGQVSVKEKKIG